MAQVIDGDGGYHYLLTDQAGAPALLISGDRNEVIVAAQLTATGSGPTIQITGQDNYVLVRTILTAGTGGIAIQGSDYGDLVYNAIAISGAVMLGGGNDFFQTNNGAGVGDVHGGTGNDVLRTYNGTYALRYWGDEGHDTLDGGAAGDLLSGGSGYDQLIGNKGNDQLTGGTDADVLIGGLGNDTIDGGNDAGDMAVYAGNYADYTVSMTAGSGTITDNNAADGDEGTDTLTGISFLRFADRVVDLRHAGNGIELTTANQVYQNDIDRSDHVAVRLSGEGARFVNTADISATSQDYFWDDPRGYLSGDKGAVIQAIADNVTIDNRAGATITGPGSAVFAAEVFAGGTSFSMSSGLTVINAGTIRSDRESGIDAGSGLNVTNAATGVIEGDWTGIQSYGAATMVNDGLIRGANYAIYSSEGPLALTNRGTIDGTVLVSTQGDLADIDNAGVIDGDITLDLSYIGYASASLTVATIDNRGSIDGDIHVTGYGPLASAPTASLLVTTEIANSGTITGDVISDPVVNVPVDVPDVSFAEHLDNSGTITGRVDLGVGNDSVINTGTIAGTVTLGSGNDLFTGGASAETVAGGDDQDWISSGSGADVLSGDAGHDSLWGGDGDDLLDGGAGDDTIWGGAGVDTVSYAAAGGGVEINLSWLEDQETRGAGVDTLVSIENVIGSAFDDVLQGDRFANILTGGGGNDVFVFGDSALAARDQVTDFAAGDILDLGRIHANGAAAGDAAFAFIGTAAFSAAGQLRLAGSGGNWTVEGDINGDHVADFFIGVTLMTPGYSLSAADFVL